ncbi:hypothetical protein [Bacteroides sp.]|uniref:NigD1/NigD2 family lipoprotein n=1 Tax=Bacteroides sp. TaxID=29523 RepID=UPI003AB895D7
MNKYCYWWLLPLLVCLLAACGDDEYHYPSVKLEFLTAYSGADGNLQSILTDEGRTLPVVEDLSSLKMDANSSARIVANYADAVAADGTTGVKLYASMKVVSPVPQAADKFENGIKTNPADILSIWLGLDYLNITLQVKEDGQHLLHFIEDEVTVDVATGQSDVYITLYHESDESMISYTRRAYASMPLRQYAVEGVQKVTVHFSLHTYSGDIKTYDIEYIPSL